jgi:ankyrin repeat protein
LLDSALLQSVEAHRTDYVERLLLLGANISIQSPDFSGETPLHQAVENGDAPMVEVLLTHGANPNLPSKRGTLPLSYVFDSSTSIENWLKILHLLVDHGADINNTGPDEYPLTVDALEVDNLAALNAVLALKPNLESLTPGGQTAAYMAATYGEADFLNALVLAGANYTPTLGSVAALGDLAKVDQMLAEGTDPNTPDFRKVQPIVFAAIGGHANVVESLLAAGADKNIPALNRALHHAAEKNHPEVAALLIRAGADVNARGGSGFPTTPLEVAAANGNLTLVKMLDEATAMRDGALPAAAQNGRIDVVSYFLDKGVDPHETIARRNLSVLTLAAGAGHADIVALLFKKGASFTPDELDQALAYAVNNYFSYYDRTAYGFSATGTKISPELPPSDPLHDTPDAYRQTVALLSASGAHAVALTNTHYSPLRLAVRGGDVQLTRNLLEQARADPNALDHNNVTILYDLSHSSSAAPLANRLQILTLLLDHGADATHEWPSYFHVYSQDTPLGSASPGNLSSLDDALVTGPAPDNREFIKLLLAHGASFNDHGGNLSEDLIRAVAIGDQAKVQQLLAAGADVNQKFRNDWTPFLVTCAVGDLPMAQLLLNAKADPKAELVFAAHGLLTLAVTSENPDLIRFAYTLRKTQHIDSPYAMPSLDQMHSPETARAVLAMFPDPDGLAQMAFRQCANRPPPPTFGVILDHLHPVPPPNNPDAKPAPASDSATDGPTSPSSTTAPAGDTSASNAAPAAP